MSMGSLLPSVLVSSDQTQLFIRLCLYHYSNRQLTRADIWPSFPAFNFEPLFDS